MRRRQKAEKSERLSRHRQTATRRSNALEDQSGRGRHRSHNNYYKAPYMSVRVRSKTRGKKRKKEKAKQPRRLPHQPRGAEQESPQMAQQRHPVATTEIAAADQGIGNSPDKRLPCDKTRFVEAPSGERPARIAVGGTPVGGVEGRSTPPDEDLRACNPRGVCGAASRERSRLRDGSGISGRRGGRWKAGETRGKGGRESKAKTIRQEGKNKKKIEKWRWKKRREMQDRRPHPVYRTHPLPSSSPTADLT